MRRRVADSFTSKEQGREMHVEATAAIDKLIEGGMTAVRELDPIVRNIFANEPAKLAAWLSASHVERAPRRKTQAQHPPTPPAT